MKNSVSKIIAILCITTLFAACNVDMMNRVNGDKNVITKTRKIANSFTEIKVSTGLDLYITQGNKNKVTVEADENLHEIIITEVEDGVLKIYSEKSIWRATAKKIHVTIKDLNVLTATSGSDVYGKGIINTDEISISATSGADINIKVNATSVETNSTSGSDIHISGITINHASNATSGSEIEAYELESKNTLAKATSGADIDIYASEKIEAKANRGGDIDFKGNPKSIVKKTTSGGSISKK